MADTKITALPTATVVNDTDVALIIQGTTPRKVTIPRLNKKVINSSTAAQNLTAGTLTLLTGSTLAIPTGVVINTNSTFQWKIIVSKTAAGLAANVFHVRCGTTGTTADTALFTFTTGAGTAVADTGRIDILVNPRSVGASGIIQGTFQMTHNLAATGLITVPANTITATSAAFNTTTANLIWSVSGTMGASAVITVNSVVSEVVNV